MEKKTHDMAELEFSNYGRYPRQSVLPVFALALAIWSGIAAVCAWGLGYL